MGRVVHFEITADDTARAKKFYEVFGWKIADAGMEGMEYFVAKTGDEKDMGIDGAIMSRDYRSQPVIPWISVENLDEMTEKAVAAGAKVIGERQSIPGIGETIYINDTEGNTVGLIQALPRAE
jgi:predicted enzyme related to lactoylglutathione lyase